MERQQWISVDAKLNVFKKLTDAQKGLYTIRRSHLLHYSNRLKDDSKFFRKYITLRASFMQGKNLNQENRSLATCQLISQSSKTSFSQPIHEEESCSNADASPLFGYKPYKHNNFNVSSLSSIQLSKHLDKLKHFSHKLSHNFIEKDQAETCETFQFSGEKLIFDQHKKCVNAVKFGHSDSSLFGVASSDSDLTICRINNSKEIEVIHSLYDHKASVTCFDWSSSNELLVSGSSDGILCLWQVSSGTCLRSVKDQANSQILSCSFHPINSNWVVAGNNIGFVEVLNISTGRFPTGGTSLISGAVDSITFDQGGSVLWAGSSKGSISSFAFSLSSGILKKGHRITVRDNSAVTSLSFRPGCNSISILSLLLASCACNNLFLFRVTGESGNLKILRQFSVPHLSYSIHSTFSPIVSFRHATRIVSGGEDGQVWLFNEHEKSPESVITLRGRSAPVISVALNHDESFLASSDASGTVIIWILNLSVPDDVASKRGNITTYRKKEPPN